MKTSNKILTIGAVIRIGYPFKYSELLCIQNCNVININYCDP